jgi:hypothetical protein
MMAYGTAGTFSSDVAALNLTLNDINNIANAFRPPFGEGGVIKSNYQGVVYYIRWKRAGNDYEFHSIALTP